jgi:hypothetical protein
MFLNGCQEKFDTGALPTGADDTSGKDTSYVEKGYWTGFNQPRMIIYGRDQLFYVADTYNDRIVMLDQAGQIKSILKNIRRPLSIAQDTRLDLLIGAEWIDTEQPHDTIGIVLRVKLVAAGHQFQNAVVDTVWREPARPRRRFLGIGVVPKDEYLIVRDGPDNSSPVDPDARVLRFRYIHIDSVQRRDTLITPLGDLLSGVGGSIININHPTGIAIIPGKGDFVLVQNSEGIQFSAIWMLYKKEFDFEGWYPKYDLSQSDQLSIDFVKPNRFLNATGVAIDKSDIYIVDAALDSVTKFNSRGVFKRESFGGRSRGIHLKNPQGIAIAEGTLYVCDSGNNRIVLYRLSD